MDIDKKLKELEKKYNSDQKKILNYSKKIKITSKQRKEYLKNPQTFVEVVVKLSTVFIIVSISSIGFGIYIFKVNALISSIWLVFGEIFLYVYIKCLDIFESNVISKITKEQLKLLENKYNDTKNKLIENSKNIKKIEVSDEKEIVKEKKIKKEKTTTSSKKSNKLEKDTIKQDNKRNKDKIEETKNEDKIEKKVKKVKKAKDEEIVISTNISPSKYVIEYQNENEFRKKERSVKKYNMLAYKKMTFEYYPKLIEGKFLGKLASKSNKDNSKNYELALPTDVMFSKVHGEMVLHYTVYEDKKVIMLTNITPDDILSEGHRSELKTYKGVMISKEHEEKDMFKINLLNSLSNSDNKK